MPVLLFKLKLIEEQSLSNTTAITKRKGVPTLSLLPLGSCGLVRAEAHVPCGTGLGVILFAW